MIYQYKNNIKTTKIYSKINEESSYNKYNVNTQDLYKTVKQMKKPSKLDYEVGDKVEHIKYGIGKVVNINEQVTDFEVTVLFDEFGEKSFYSLFAKLKKCNV